LTATDESAVRTLIARFAEATDVGTLEEYAACLTEEATMVIGTVTRSGRAEIVEAMDSGRRQGLFGPASGSIHLVGASVVDVDGDAARASSSFVFVAGVSGRKQVVGTGRYVDSFERAADGWRLAHRRIDMI
jgi:ketosteroid isomerase-like protein